MNDLHIAESIDSYIKRTKEDYNNMLARKNCAYTTSFNSYFITIRDFLVKNPIFSTVKVIQLDRSAENGYPHTRPDIICIPSSARFPQLETTLYHEYVHIHQRRNMNQWTAFLKSEGWEPIDEKLIPERWKERVRYNPDTIYSQYWCFNKRYVPLPIFTNLGNPKMEDVKVMFYDLQSGILEHEMPEVMVSKYKGNRQIEHPFELYAVMMENKIKSDEDILSFMRTPT